MVIGIQVSGGREGLNVEPTQVTPLTSAAHPVSTLGGIIQQFLQFLGGMLRSTLAARRAKVCVLCFSHSQSGERKANIRTCVENGLLKTLVRLLDSHVTIQAQSISIVEEIFGQNKGQEMVNNIYKLSDKLNMEIT